MGQAFGTGGDSSTNAFSFSFLNAQFEVFFELSGEKRVMERGGIRKRGGEEGQGLILGLSIRKTITTKHYLFLRSGTIQRTKKRFRFR